MAPVTLKRAAEMTGKNASTIHRAAEKGRISVTLSGTGERLFDPAELDRVFGLRPVQLPLVDAAIPSNHESDVAIAVLRAELRAAQDRARDLEADRDAWKDQARQLARLSPPVDQAPTPRANWWQRLTGKGGS